MDTGIYQYEPACLCCVLSGKKRKLRIVRASYWRMQVSNLFISFRINALKDYCFDSVLIF
jgi:hypothetical protein